MATYIKTPSAFLSGHGHDDLPAQQRRSDTVIARTLMALKPSCQFGVTYGAKLNQSRYSTGRPVYEEKHFLLTTVHHSANLTRGLGHNIQ